MSDTVKEKNTAEVKRSAVRNHKLEYIVPVIVFCVAFITCMTVFYFRDNRRYSVHDSYTVYLSDDSLSKIESFDVKKIYLDKKDASVRYITDSDTVIYSKDGTVVIDKGGQVETYSNAFIMKD